MTKLDFGGSGGPAGSANGLRDTGGAREAGMAETGMMMRARGKAIGYELEKGCQVDLYEPSLGFLMVTARI